MRYPAAFAVRTVWEHASERYLEQKGIEVRERLSEVLFTMSMQQGAAYVKEKLGASSVRFADGGRPVPAVSGVQIGMGAYGGNTMFQQLQQNLSCERLLGD